MQEVFKTSLQEVFKTSSRRLGRQKIVSQKRCWKRLQGMSWRRLEDQQMFAGFKLNLNLFFWLPNKILVFSLVSEKLLWISVTSNELDWNWKFFLIFPKFCPPLLQKKQQRIRILRRFVWRILEIQIVLCSPLLHFYFKLVVYFQYFFVHHCSLNLRLEMFSKVAALIFLKGVL